MAVLRASDLRKSYGGEKVVAGVSFGIAAGECFGLLGPNGAGKTTTFLPLTQAVAVARPLLLGEVPGELALHVLVLLAYAAAGFYAATVLLRRRLLT